MESPGDHVRKKPSSSSLAEDILAIRAALDGASASARERTLKTLERLTASYTSTPLHKFANLNIHLKYVISLEYSESMNIAEIESKYINPETTA